VGDTARKCVVERCELGGVGRKPTMARMVDRAGKLMDPNHASAGLVDSLVMLQLMVQRTSQNGVYMCS